MTAFAFCSSCEEYRPAHSRHRFRSAPRAAAAPSRARRQLAASNAAPLARSFPAAARPEPTSGRLGTTRPQPRPAGSPLRRSGHPSHTAGEGRAISRVARPTTPEPDYAPGELMELWGK